MRIRRGDIFYADLGNKGDGSSVQKGVRPVVILSNNKGNKTSPTVIVACITSKLDKNDHFPTHYYLPEQVGMHKNSVVLLEQLLTIDTSDLTEKITELNRDEMRAVEKRLLVSLGMSRNYRLIRQEEIAEERRKRKLRKEKEEQKRNEVKIKR